MCELNSLFEDCYDCFDGSKKRISVAIVKYDSEHNITISYNLSLKKYSSIGRLISKSYTVTIPMCIIDPMLNSSIQLLLLLTPRIDRLHSFRAS